ncbi:MAG: DNA polymerase III subunit delta, partial [Leptospirillia bacterium]
VAPAPPPPPVGGAPAQTLPVMAERRLVVLRGIERIAADQLAVLAEYVKDPSPTTCLVLEGEKADMRRSPFSQIRKVGAVVDCKPLYENQVPGWIGARVRTMGYSIEPAAAQFLATYSGTQLMVLARELEKAAAYLSEGDTHITLEAVGETVGSHRVHTVFELTDALGERRAAAALTALTTLLDAGEPPIKVQAMIVRHFRLLWRAVEAISSGRRDLPQAIGVAPFLVRKLQAQARRHSDASLTTAFCRFAGVDFDLKGGAVSPRRTLENEVLALCG